MAIRSMTPNRARRLAAAAQRLHAPRPASVDVRHLRTVMAVNNVLQLDSVTVAARAHEMPYWSRVGAHDTTRRDDHLWRSGEHVELVAHEQCVVPTAIWPLLAESRVDRHRWKGVEQLMADRPGYVESVYEHVATHGPTAHGDLRDGGGEKHQGIWGMNAGKAALVWLAARGRLCIADRDHRFQVTFDLAERVLPAEVLAQPEPPAHEARRTLLLLAARANGVGTAADLADHWRMVTRDCRPVLESLADDGLLVRTQVHGWRELAYRHPDVAMPRSIEGARLLSPFDPLVWFRPRLERLWGFDYRIEIYVPRETRRWGYYVLPFLLDGVLSARVDLKADRAAGVLRVLAAHVEDGVDPAYAARALTTELRAHATWLGLDDVAVSDVGGLAPFLRTTASR
jgi:uncharacterized protein YcaQ